MLLTKHRRKSKMYHFNIKRLLRESLKLYKHCTSDKQMIKKHKNEYQKAVKFFYMEHAKGFCQNSNAKSFNVMLNLL